MHAGFVCCIRASQMAAGLRPIHLPSVFSESSTGPKPHLGLISRLHVSLLNSFVVSTFQ